ncbi:MAG: UDP-N-acetylmuramate dehydrogenase, partial [Lachnospiraceae bacterium]|nr:UDP-N-acetylmuramate dehydrogenase [Lachnospiraceae bacterium]
MTAGTYFESRLNDICGSECVRRNVRMSEYTTFRTGGPADYFVVPKDRESLLKLLWYMKQSEREYLILGRGSNILVGDKGYRGTVVSTSEALKDIVTEENTITAGAGARLSEVANIAAEASLTGMEFASGIPGSVGGAVFMNAGAYGGEMSQIVSSVEVLGPAGEVINVLGSDMGFGYRTSVVQKEELPVISASFRLERGNREEIFAKIKELGVERAKKQPLEFPSAGSAFKRPEGYYAAKLITDTGLSGLTIG